VPRPARPTTVKAPQMQDGPGLSRLMRHASFRGPQVKEVLRQFFDEQGTTRPRRFAYGPGVSAVLPNHARPAVRQRWRMLSVISITNGLIEAQIARRAELLRRPGERSDDFIEKMRAREHRCYQALDAMVMDVDRDIDLAQLSVAVGCSYADFRFKSDDWRQANPNLASWFGHFIQRPSMQSTMPNETPE
jgi:glutathione S-transferase